MSKKDKFTSEFISICKKVHKEYGDEGLDKMIKSKSVPPVKLTKSEMQFLKGGSDAFDAMASSISDSVDRSICGTITLSSILKFDSLGHFSSGKYYSYK